MKVTKSRLICSTTPLGLFVQLSTDSSIILRKVFSVHLYRKVLNIYKSPPILLFLIIVFFGVCLVVCMCHPLLFTRKSSRLPHGTTTHRCRIPWFTYPILPRYSSIPTRHFLERPIRLLTSNIGNLDVIDYTIGDRWTPVNVKKERKEKNSVPE